METKQRIHLFTRFVFQIHSHMCFVANGSDSESESEDEEEHECDSEDEDDLQQFFAQLSKKNRMSLLKLIKKQKNKKKCFISKKISSSEKLNT